MLAGLAEGQTSEHGPISVSQTGLKTPKGEVTWWEIASVAVENGVLVITDIGERRAWSRVDIARIRNVAVLHGVVERLRRT